MRNKSFYYPLMIAMLLLLCTPFVTVVYAQSFTVTGTVADSQGGVPGVNVKVKGSTTGTITDMDGKFTLPNLSLSSPTSDIRRRKYPSIIKRY